MSLYSTYRIGGGIIKESNQVLQHQYAKIVNNSTQYLITSSTSFLNTGCIATITPSAASNKICIEFNTPMSYGRSVSILLTRLKRTINGVTDYPVNYTNNGTTTPRYSYSWAYTSRNFWQSSEYYFFDEDHNTTNEISYEIQYRERTNSTSGYLGHQYMPIYLSATEIKV
jgi:hypothetical protein